MSTAPHTWPRLFLAEILDGRAEITLGPEPSHYLTHVLRAAAGDPVRLFDGQNGEWRGVITALSQNKKSGVTLSLEEKLREQNSEPDLWLCCAPIKRAHFDFMIQKATELGVSVIQPVLTARAQIRETNTARLRAIAIEAAEQSERLTIPDVREVLTLNQLIKTWPAPRLPILCAEFGDAQSIGKALRKTDQAAVITGPEGGFAPDEMAALRTLPNVLPVRLGPRILRADTAALAALSCWQALCGDWQ